MQVKWTEPKETGGRDITEFQVQMRPSAAQPEVTASGFLPPACMQRVMCACFASRVVGKTARLRYSPTCQSRHLWKSTKGKR